MLSSPFVESCDLAIGHCLKSSYSLPMPSLSLILSVSFCLPSSPLPDASPPVFFAVLSAVCSIDDQRDAQALKCNGETDYLAVLQLPRHHPVQLPTYACLARLGQPCSRPSVPHLDADRLLMELHRGSLSCWTLAYVRWTHLLPPCGSRRCRRRHLLTPWSRFWSEPLDHPMIEFPESTC